MSNLPSPYDTLQRHVDTLQWALRDHAAPPATWFATVKAEWEAITALHVQWFGGRMPRADEVNPGDWVAVVDDSDCTVRLGGPGAIWRVRAEASPTTWWLHEVASPYTKTIFRKATADEIRAHLDR